MPRYMVERTFPDGPAIPSIQQGRDATAKVTAKNAEGGVTWLHSHVSPGVHAPPWGGNESDGQLLHTQNSP